MIRALFDGKVARPLPGEPVPEIEGEVEAQIILKLATGAGDIESRDAIERLRQRREKIAPLNLPIKELIEEGRRF